MAAAYAAVVSVMHLMEQIQAYHVQYPIFIETQLRQLESLRLKVSLLLNFLESHSDGDGRNDTLIESFECRIVDACYALEDVVEPYIEDHIHGRFKTVLSKKRKTQESMKKEIVLGGSIIHLEHNLSCFSQNVQKITEYIDSIDREILVEIRDQSRVVKEQEFQVLDQASSLRLLTTGMDTLVGLDDISEKIMDKLTGPQRNIQVISITGMGGSGKSTLAKKLYDNKYITQRFDICRWVTISQEFNVKAVLLTLLGETHDQSPSKDDELGERLYKMLFGMRYFIVIDDIWSAEAWDGTRLFLPDNGNGSRIIITTRLMDLASHIGSSNPYRMNLLDENESWILLQKKVFLHESCPPDLEKIGRKIAEDCKGLPLSIVVIGGLLAKSVNIEYWEGVGENVSKIVNSEEDERCLKILALSYHHLPIHLKPCFLYFGMFQEDDDIRVSKVVRLWIAEGFVKPMAGKSLEEAAIVYCKDLINRNLIFATEIGCTGNVKLCKIHDLLRDLCLREAEKQRFMYATKVNCHHDILQGFSERRRISLLLKRKSSRENASSHLESSPFLRSFIYNSKYDLDSLVSSDVKLLRVLVTDGVASRGNWRCLVNSKYLDFTVRYDSYTSSFPSSTFYLFWNLQTIHVFFRDTVMLSSEIWEMPQLRKLHIVDFKLDDGCDEGKRGRQDNIVLENLQTLMSVVNFSCSEEVVMKIPNVKKLKVRYDNVLAAEYIKNLSRMAKLESLYCYFYDIVPRMNISGFNVSPSLRKLNLSSCDITWEDIGRKIGWLPCLEKLRLWRVNGGEEWNSVDGQFCCLKYLLIYASDLVFWTADSSSFPRLEKVVLEKMYTLEEIPCEIGDIASLVSIVSNNCSDSASASARRIQEEQRSFGNEDLVINVKQNFKHEIAARDSVY